MLDHVINQSKQSLHTREPVESILLHLETTNEQAKQFYEKRGFVVDQVIPQYYRIRNSEPKDALLMRLDLI